MHLEAMMDGAMYYLGVGFSLGFGLAMVSLGVASFAASLTLAVHCLGRLRGMWSGPKG